MEDLNLPEIKRERADKKNADKKEFKGLFDSDSDDDGSEDLFKSKGKNFRFRFCIVTV